MYTKTNLLQFLKDLFEVQQQYALLIPKIRGKNKKNLVHIYTV